MPVFVGSFLIGLSLSGMVLKLFPVLHSSNPVLCFSAPSPGGCSETETRYDLLMRLDFPDRLLTSLHYPWIRHRGELWQQPVCTGFFLAFVFVSFIWIDFIVGRAVRSHTVVVLCLLL
ncbi:hypothetical protein B9Z19DRAFT_1091415 [Tuber borchii]|uniref:Uncharacterized protein n=1 Tax=Tuber borchii TaxID=42251 RepID=A0A2T6ZHI6_TUBBO|nr:hypothetical protein B9Z19DRAFT_1091415 [Tuber borchii]